MGGEDPSDHAGGRGLSIRSGYVNNRIGLLGVIEEFDQRFDPGKVGLETEASRVESRNGLGVVHGAGVSDSRSKVDVDMETLAPVV